MRVCCLASGSGGNLTYIESDNTKILIDCGLTLCEVEKRLNQIDVSPSEISAILITHEHKDHIAGVSAFVKKYGTKVFAHVEGWPAIDCKTKINDKYKVAFYDNDFYIEDLTVCPFRLSHDSLFCVGYVIYNCGNKVSIATDTGYLPEAAKDCMAKSDLIIIESNHDEQMLLSNPTYTIYLKKRILSKKGHLSNNACASAIYDLVHMGTKQFVLAHLSEKNNTPLIAYTSVCEGLKSRGVIEGKHLFIDVAFQDKVGTMFVIK